MNRSRRLLAATVAVVALVGVVTLASAASLPVGPATLTSVAVGHPCSGTAAATAATGSGVTYSAVSVTLPAGCASRYVTLQMTNGTTTLTGTGQVTASNVAVVTFVPPTTYNATSAWTILATVDGWNLPTTWSFTLPPIWCTVVSGGTAGATCTASVTLRYDNGRDAWYYDVVVQTTSTQWLVWEVGFNLSNSFYGTVPTSLGNSTLDVYDDGPVTWDNERHGTWGNYWWAINDVARTSNCSTLPGSLLVRGENNGPTDDRFSQLRNDRERRFSLVVNITQGDYDDVVWTGCSAP